MKRIVVLLIACLLMCLAGCGEKTPTSIEIPVSDTPPEIEQSEVGKKTGVIIKDKKLVKNFKLVCEQIGIDPDEICDMTQIEDWVGGSLYTFVYDDLFMQALCNTDCTVESIFIGNDLCVFDRRAGTYHIDDYKADPELLERVEGITDNLISEKIECEEGSFVPYTEWYADRVLNRYNVVGAFKAVNEQGEEDSLSFEVCFECDTENKQFLLRYFKIGDIVFDDTLAELPEVERAPAVEQVRESLSSGKDGFLLVEGELGQYGKETEDPKADAKYMGFYIPAGKYKVTSKVPLCYIYVNSNEFFTSDDGYLSCDIISETELSGINTQKEITVGENEHIALSYCAKVVFEPIR